jgi:transposase
MGIDEIAIKKGHKDFACVIYDVDRGEVIEMLESRKKEVVVSYLRGLQQEQKSAIVEVSIDMWEGYRYAVEEELPQAQIVIDKFHVVKELSSRIDKTRREIQKSLSKEEYESVKGIRWSLLKDSKDLTSEEKQRLRVAFKVSPELERMYDLREEFRGIYNSGKNYRVAKAAVVAWMKKVQDGSLENLKKFVSTLNNWFELILNYFNHKTTNAVAEGLNNKIKVIKRRAYGFRNFKNFRRRVIVACGGL